MKVSVLIITYNHENYIKQAIDSVLVQKVNFDYNIVIGEDCSSDKTRDIIIEYKQKFPEIINLITSDNNVGPIGNLIRTFKACKGEYIALLEGDDYWIDPNKMQYQIDFLDSNPKFVGCFHNTEERYADESKASFLYCSYSNSRNISFEDLSYKNVIPTCSVVFKNNLFGGLPVWLDDLKMADWPLHLLNSQKGDYWYIPKVMAVHRLHYKSLWMLQDANRNNQFVIEAYDIMIKEFGVHSLFSEQLMNGKKAFLNSLKEIKSQSKFRKRMKSLVINMLEKL